jgi:hypothetical protein
MTLREIEIEKDLVYTESVFKSQRTVYTATFWYNDVQYCGVIYPWLQEEYSVYSEGGYVVGHSVTYTWLVEDIEHITTYKLIEDSEGNEREEYGTLEKLTPELKKFWLDELGNFMTEKELFID